VTTLLESPNRSTAPERRDRRNRAGVIAICLGAVICAAAALTPNRAIEQALLGPDARSLSWGPTLLRAMTALHGLLLLLAGAIATARARGAWGLNPFAAEEAESRGPVREPRESAPAAWLILGGLLVIALALRLWRLDLGLWFDEVVTLVRFTRPPVGEILTSFPNQNQHMLYSLLSHASFALFGEGAWQLRLPAAFFGVASIAALFMLVRHLAGTREALLACALMTFSYHHIWFSQNARGYSGVLFFATLASWLWIHALPRPNAARAWIAFAVTVALGMWVHMTMAFVAFAMGLTWLILLAHSLRTGSRRLLASRWQPLAALALGGTLTLQLYALGLPEFLSHGLHEVSRESEWTNPLWLVTETIKGLHLGFAGSAVLIAGALVFAAGFFSVLRRNWVAAFIAVVPGVVLCATMIALEHNLWPRFVFFAAGFGIFFVIRGIHESSDLVVNRLLGREQLAPALSTAACLLLIAASATTVRTCYHPKQDYAGARDYVAANLGPDDAAVSVGMAGRMFQMYFAPDWPWVQTQDELDDVRRRSETVWLVYTTPIHMKAWFPELWDDVQRDFEMVRQFKGTLGGGTVYVCRQRKGAIAAAAR
jgi:hypothetical protein